jgi:3-oxoacyl-[acyl-carrier-protein] synthase I
MSGVDPSLIKGVGAATCLGPWITAAAAARCGVTRFGAVPGLLVPDEESGGLIPLIGAPATWVTHGFEGAGRVLRLAIAALADLRNNSVEPIQWDRTAIFFALAPFAAPSATPKVAVTADPELLADEFGMPEPDIEPPPLPAPSSEQLARVLVARVMEHAELDQRLVHGIYTKERWGTVGALHDGLLGLSSRHIEQALVIAADSAIDPGRLALWASARRLKTPGEADGFMPGEAAVALLLGSRARGRAPVLHAPVLASEAPHPDDAPSGRALSAVLVSAAKRLRAPPRSIYVDLNGEARRAAELGHAASRMPPDCALRDSFYEIPATSFGETGAAGPLLAAALAARSFSRGYAQGTTCLVSVMDDAGNRAAFGLEAGS